MPKSIISEGKTSTEAIEKGLKKLNVTKNMVEIKVLETEKKKSFFSILEPRIVKVELTIKENIKNTEKAEIKEKHVKPQKEKIEKESFRRMGEKHKLSTEEREIAKSNLTTFLTRFCQDLEEHEIIFEIGENESYITVQLEGKDIHFLIGYRGEVLNAFQLILNSVSNRASKEKTRIILNISDYREKREKSLEELADKISKTVIRTGKAITLEPMMAYERKIIHNRLQSSNKVKTYSIGEEPYRKVVISKK